MPTLIPPTPALKSEYLEMLEDWLAANEIPIPGVLRADPTDFPALIQKLIDRSHGIGLTDGKPPHTTYWLVNENHKILGAVNIRHHLNEELKNIGGHIGFGIRPSERHKGYATDLLLQALKICHQLGIKKALVTCDTANVASSRTIQKCGGILESESIHEGIPIQRYWVNTNL